MVSAPGTGVGRPLRRYAFGVALAALLLAGSHCSIRAAWLDAPATVAAFGNYPGTTWEPVPNAESAGFSRAGLDKAESYLATLGTTGAVVAVGGRVLLDYGNTTEVSYLASVRKSVLAMLFGKYVRDGHIRLDKTLRELGLDDREGLAPHEKEATVADLLAARSGIYHPASNPGDDLAQAPPRGSRPHGTHFLYNNWDFNALGTIFERETGRSIYDALETDLAQPIGMEHFDRAAQRKSGDTTRSRHLAYHMWLSTRDMARVGHLMLRRGAWNGRQVIPAEWVERMITPVTRWNEMNPRSHRNGRFGYGYLWWVFDGPQAIGAYEDGYTGVGALGQYITVLPRLDIVIAHKTVPGRPRGSVSRAEYLRFVDLVVSAHCGQKCTPAADSSGADPNAPRLRY